MTETETYSFGEWLKQRREGLRLTQRELAARVHCSTAMIKKIEADERRPSPELAELLTNALQISEPNQEIFFQVARGERPVDALWRAAGQAADSADIPSLPAYTPSSLPRPATPFVGRADELIAVSERLADPNCRLLTLVGPGGVGKTRLALEAATKVISTPLARAEISDAAFIPLAALTDTRSIPQAIARSLRLTLNGPPAEQVLAYLHRRSLLMVLDNCEQLEGDLSWLAELITHAPGVKLLATSRERLHLAEEWVYVVPDLAQAVDLFLETARRVKQDFHIEDEQAAVLRICQQVENLPLAVELAASWTPLMSCMQIAEYIERDIAILAADVRNAPERHHSIQAVFDHSWNLLSAAEQNALMRLSVFRGGWQAEEAGRVAGIVEGSAQSLDSQTGAAFSDVKGTASGSPAAFSDAQRPVSQAGANLLLLRRLVDKSLVRVGESGRFDLHELTRQYAMQKLSQSGQEAETRERHFAAYQVLAERLDRQQYSAQAMLAVARFDQEQDNIYAALDWGLEAGHTEEVLNLLNHLWFYWSRRGYYHQGAEWAVRAVRQAGDQESLPLCIALSNATVMLSIQGRFAEGEALAHRAITMANRLEEPEALIVTWGIYTFTSTNVEQALSGLRKGINLIQETGLMQEHLPFLYLGSATWLHSSGQYAEAEAYYRKGIALFRQLRVEDFITDPLGRLGQLMLQEGRLQEAYALTVESITAARSGGFAIVFSAWGTARLGLIQLYLGEVDAAQRSLEEALQFFEDSPASQRPKQETLAVMSEVALARGDLQSADNYMQASLKICGEFYRELQATQKLSGTPDALPLDLIGLCARAGLVAAAQGNAARALTLYSLADSLRSQSKQRMIPPLQAKIDESMAGLRPLLPENSFAAAWQAGQKMTISAAFAFLLG